jgi:hypothetical protein
MCGFKETASKDLAKKKLLDTGDRGHELATPAGKQSEISGVFIADSDYRIAASPCATKCRWFG